MCEEVLYAEGQGIIEQSIFQHIKTGHKMSTNSFPPTPLETPCAAARPRWEYALKPLMAVNALP